MDPDPMQFVEEDGEKKSSDKDKTAATKAYLNTWVAISVALLATFMGICKVKDDNIVQAMQQAQADKIDNYSWYQARNVQEEVRSEERRVGKEEKRKREGAKGIKNNG